MTFQFQPHECVRLLPHRRQVWSGLWAGEPAFAKFYLGRNACRDLEAEEEGLRRLHQAGIAAPLILSRNTRCESPDGQSGSLLVLAAIPGARSLAEAFSEADASGRARLAEETLAIFRKLHSSGLDHRDCHFGNFIVGDQGLHLIDGDAVRPLVDATASMAMLLAQFPAGFQPDLSAFDQPEALRLAAARARFERIRRLRRKVFRSCTAVESSCIGSARCLFAPAADCLALQELLADPDASLHLPGSRVLKDGRTCTVWTLPLDSVGQVVVKRYNLEWPGALLKGFVPGRGARSWAGSFLLADQGLPNPEALALIENRLGPWRGTSWIVTRYQEGRDLLSLITDAGLPDEALEDLLMQAARLILDLASIGGVHGDCKAQNFLVSPQGKLSWIDLDSLQFQAAPLDAAKAGKDRRRFLRNLELAPWRSPELRRRLAATLRLEG
jgi:tRNA A-37 threonylcarbamoyl transferase component Bud32